AHGRENRDGILSRLLLSLRLLVLSCLYICVMSWVCCRPRFRIFIHCGGLTYLRQPWGVRNAKTVRSTSIYIVDPHRIRGGESHETFIQHSLAGSGEPCSNAAVNAAHDGRNAMEVQFSIGTFSAGEKCFPGIVIADRVYNISSVIPEVTSTAVLLSDWKNNFERLNEFAQDEQKRAAFDSTPVVDLQILPPVTPTGQLIAAGANYRQHVIEITVAHQLGDPDASAEALREQAAQEVDDRAQNGEPYVWVGSAAGISGAYDDVLLPEVGSDHDWELELGVVIGQNAYRVSEQDAMDYVAGYTICNDITTRSLVPRKDIPMMGTDWMRSKNHPTFF